MNLNPNRFGILNEAEHKTLRARLAVIKRMTEALGGTVTFESQEGKGTTFKVRLPQNK